MESVVASVSGYHGSERFNLIKLISQTGASFVGNMTNAITHLVCHRFEGRKYIIAKKFQMFIVNHRWIEDCVKARGRVPEHSYTVNSGEEVGPLHLEALSAQICGNCLPKTNHNTQVTQLRAVGKSCKRVAKERCQHEEESALIDCFLLKKDTGRFLPQCVKQKRKKHISVKVTVDEAEVKQKRRKHIPIQKTLDGAGLFLEEKRQVKNGMDEDISYYQCNSSDKESGWNKVAVLDSRLEERGECKTGTIETSSNLCSKDAQIVVSRDVSCVICWTDFSSSRGILPCGHRFCYTCIQSWANHMVCKGKMARCPMCKAEFKSIKKVEDVSPSEQNVYSQTIPSPLLGVDVFLFPPPSTHQESVCSECGSAEPLEMLVKCRICMYQSIHSYCLDPPLLPWTCSHCKSFYL